ncbi:MAG: hypothetical protein U1E56_01705 [Bauldia sp.]
MSAAKTVRPKSPKPQAKAGSGGFSAEERAAMKARAREMKAGTDGEADLVAAIAALAPQDRAMAKWIDAIVRAAAPGLAAKTWYGMPAYAKDGAVICFFQSSAKFRTRYATLGFSDKARLDDGPMWPTAFALTEMSPAVEARIAALVKRAAG